MGGEERKVERRIVKLGYVVDGRVIGGSCWMVWDGMERKRGVLVGGVDVLGCGVECVGIDVIWVECGDGGRGWGGEEGKLLVDGVVRDEMLW